jgi:dihydrofolate reductase
MGRKTYEIAKTRRELFSGSAPRWVVVSATLNPQSEPDIELIADRLPEKVAALKSEPGKDIWLFGGGVLFRSLLDAGLVDSVVLTVIPLMLGSGTPLLAEGARAKLNLTESKTLPSGTLILKYSIVP